MMVTDNLIELANVEELGKLVKVEHRIVLAVVAKERDVLTQIHIF